MTNKPFDGFITLSCLVVGVILLVAGFAMGQPSQLGIGVWFVIMGLLSFVAARKRRSM